jgi:hypothetical protein
MNTQNLSLEPIERKDLSAITYLSRSFIHEAHCPSAPAAFFFF